MPLNCEVVGKVVSWPPICRGKDFGLSSVRELGGYVAKKERKKKKERRIPVKHKSTDKYVGDLTSVALAP